MTNLAEGKEELLTDLLRSVSRSFYQTLKILPRKVRRQIGLAYLLARMSDSIADTALLPVSERLTALDSYRDCVQGKGDRAQLQNSLSRITGEDAEARALRRADEAIAVLESLAPEDQELIRNVLGTITSGQRLDVERFGNASEKAVVAIESLDELRDYTFRVAGCVGEFWTEICRKRLFSGASIQGDEFLKKGVEFGHGLQLTNILRDVASDLRIGRCYLPRRELAKLLLKPEDLLNPASYPQMRGLYDYLLRKAEEGLRAGWDYTQMAPVGQIRFRLACAWPALIGLRTIKALRQVNPLKPEHRVKISRREVKSILAQSILLYPAPFLWRRLVKPGK